MKKYIYLILITLCVNVSWGQGSETLEGLTSSYLNQLKFAQQEGNKAEKQTAYNKASEYAKNLLGVVPGVNINFSDRINNVCNLLNEKAKALEKDKASENKKLSLKASRDISNYNEISKFLKCSSKLLDTLYKSPGLLDSLLQKIPEFIPQLGKELTVMLRVLELTVTDNADDKLNEVISKLRDFAKQSDDGTYLLSPLISISMNTQEQNSLDFEKIIQETDFSSLDVCCYLNIK